MQILTTSAANNQDALMSWMVTNNSDTTLMSNETASMDLTGMASNDSDYAHQSQPTNMDHGCPVYNKNENALIDQFNVWIEGVMQTCVAIPGFLGK